MKFESLFLFSSWFLLSSLLCTWRHKSRTAQDCWTTPHQGPHTSCPTGSTDTQHIHARGAHAASPGCRTCGCHQPMATGVTGSGSQFASAVAHPDITLPPPFTPDKELTTLSSGYFAQDSHLPASKKQQNTFPSLQFSKII